MAGDFGLVAFGAGCAAIGSAVTGYVLRRLEHARDVRDAGRIEVERKRHLDKYEALRQVSGRLTDLQHCSMHVSAPDTREEQREYAERGMEVALQVRALVRADVQALGDEMLGAVNDATDAASRLFRAADAGDSPEILMSLRHDWMHASGRALMLADRLHAATERPQPNT